MKKSLTTLNIALACLMSFQVASMFAMQSGTQVNPTGNTLAQPQVITSPIIEGKPGTLAQVEIIPETVKIIPGVAEVPGSPTAPGTPGTLGRVEITPQTVKITPGVAEIPGYAKTLGSAPISTRVIQVKSRSIFAKFRSLLWGNKLKLITVAGFTTAAILKNKYVAIGTGIFATICAATWLYLKLPKKKTGASLPGSVPVLLTKSKSLTERLSNLGKNILLQSKIGQKVVAPCLISCIINPKTTVAGGVVGTGLVTSALLKNKKLALWSGIAGGAVVVGRLTKSYVIDPIYTGIRLSGLI